MFICCRVFADVIGVGIIDIFRRQCHVEAGVTAFEVKAGCKSILISWELPYE